MAIKKTNDFKNLNNDIQKEALINEIKGNLFEYLLAHTCARRFGVEKSFLSSLDAEMKSMLNRYEKWLRENDRQLTKNLTSLAQSCSESLITYFNENNISIMSHVFVFGKISKSKLGDELKEADIVFQDEKKIYPVSVKLSKKNSYVNTKSAGIKSFISTYFDLFEDSKSFQEVFNNIVDKTFFEFAESLYENRKIDFQGRFDENWTGPDLPGELIGVEHEALLKMYQVFSRNLYQILMELSCKDPKSFYACLQRLCGHSLDSLIHVTCFHKEDRLKNSTYDSCHIYCSEFGREDNHQLFEFQEFKEEISSFEIKLDDLILQIRIKPMNKFTNTSYKVNCSVKYLQL